LLILLSDELHVLRCYGILYVSSFIRFYCFQKYISVNTMHNFFTTKPAKPVRSHSLSLNVKIERRKFNRKLWLLSIYYTSGSKYIQTTQTCEKYENI